VGCECLMEGNIERADSGYYRVCCECLVNGNIARD
jgi:hypothetical protein